MSPVSGQEVRGYIHDTVGQLTTVITADGSLILYEYDAAGNRIQRLVLPPSGPDSVTAILPSSVPAGDTTESTIFGEGMATATAVTFAEPGIAAVLSGTPGDFSFNMDVTVDAEVTPGSYPFTVERSAGGPIASDPVALVVQDGPVLTALSPSSILQGTTLEPWRLEGLRLDDATDIVFGAKGLEATILQVAPDGTFLDARLVAAPTAGTGDGAVRVTSPSGLSNRLDLSVERRGAGLVGSFWEFFELDGSGLPVIPQGEPLFQRSDSEIDFGESTNFIWAPCAQSSVCLGGTLNLTVVWEGSIYLAAGGDYTFALRSSDASALYLDDTLVVANPGIHAPALMSGPFSNPAPQVHHLELHFNSAAGNPRGVDLLYQPPGGVTLKPVPLSALFNDRTVPRSFASALASVSIFSPETIDLPMSVLAAVSLANGPAVATVQPRQISRSGSMPAVLTITGNNLSGADGVVLDPLNDVVVGSPVASPDGTTITVDVTLTGSTPLGIVQVSVSKPGFTTAASAAMNFEVVP